MSRVLVVGPSWVGDMVMAQALFRRIVRMDPDAEVHVIGPGWSVPITARMGEVARSYVLDVPHGTFGLSARRTLGHALRPMAFDTAFVLPRSFKSALVPYFARVPRRRGYRGEMRFGLLNDIVPPRARPLPGAPKIRTVDQFVAMADPGEPVMREEEAPVLARDAASEAATREALGLAHGPAVALCPAPSTAPPSNGRSNISRSWRRVSPGRANRSGSWGRPRIATPAWPSARRAAARPASLPGKPTWRRPSTFWPSPMRW